MTSASLKENCYVKLFAADDSQTEDRDSRGLSTKNFLKDIDRITLTKTPNWKAEIYTVISHKKKKEMELDTQVTFITEYLIYSNYKIHKSKPKASVKHLHKVMMAIFHNEALLLTLRPTQAPQGRRRLKEKKCLHGPLLVHAQKPQS